MKGKIGAEFLLLFVKMDIYILLPQTLPFVLTKMPFQA